MDRNKTNISLGPEGRKYLKDVQSPWKMKLYFLSKLPSMWWWRVRIVDIDPEKSTIRLPYSWRTKNPFRSTYFAAQTATAELSTGILAILALKDQPSVSMLVTEVRSEFTKKATGATYFTCEDGSAVFAAVRKAIATEEPQTITMESTGRMKDGTVVSTTQLTWSFKKR
jgi:hypothetical protein